MRKLAFLCTLGAFLSISTALKAQEEKVRTICNVADPKNKCQPATPNCVCIPDTFEVTFDGNTNSIFEYETFAAGTKIDVVIVTDTKTARVQGWSYGVHHEDTYLDLAKVVPADALAGTDAGAIIGRQGNSGFNQTSSENIEGGGWISAVVLSLTQDFSLDLKRNTIAKAS